MTKPLWRPSKALTKSCQMMQFMDYINHRYQKDFFDYNGLYRWSITQLEDFWQAVWEFCNIKASKMAEQVMQQGQCMRDTKWFVGSRLNFAENLLQRHDGHPAIIFHDEQSNHHSMSYQHLQYKVAKLAAYLRKVGITAGDRIVAVLPNLPETVIAMLASSCLGAIWSSCSPDFGLQGLLDRFGQIEPKLIFFSDGHYYKGKYFNQAIKIKALIDQVPSIQNSIFISYPHNENDLNNFANCINIDKIFAQQHEPIVYTQFPFNHPLYILYSSGTTGQPKCLVHGAGGTLIQHKKELMLHTNLQTEDTIFFNTTCGWMMWNWLVSSLSVGATIVLYEGNPFYPANDILIDLIDKFQINIFGVGAKYLETLHKKKIKPKNNYSLKSLHTILSTGSPLLPETAEYICRDFKAHIQLSSISGGSDIISCFALGNPIKPVYAGELQCIGLGMNVKIYNETGNPVVEKKGELVCASAFPSMPLYFWNDKEHQKYNATYFNKYPHVWAHGDYAMITQHDGLIIYGRSDATLNPGGVRIGTAEIYQQVEAFDEVLDCMAIGQPCDDNEKIVLFIVLKKEKQLSDTLIQAIKNAIRNNTSPHHVPTFIIQVPDLPRTINGKLSEIIVKKIMAGESIDNKESIANPECLAYFKHFLPGHNSNEIKEK